MYEIFNNEIGKASVEEVDGKLFFHYESRMWSPAIYKKLLQVWALITKHIKEMGYDEVYVAIPDNDPKLYKFEQMFCFEEVYRSDGTILMVREL